MTLQALADSIRAVRDGVDTAQKVGYDDSAWQEAMREKVDELVIVATELGLSI